MLLAAGVIAYLGAFTPEFRSQQTEKWLIECKAKNVPCSDQFTLSSVSSCLHYTLIIFLQNI